MRLSNPTPHHNDDFAFFPRDPMFGARQRQIISRECKAVRPDYMVLRLRNSVVIIALRRFGDQTPRWELAFRLSQAIVIVMS